MEPRLIPELVNSAQTAKRRDIIKVAALKEAQKSPNPRFTRGEGEI
jgi:hypothetical protein